MKPLAVGSFLAFAALSAACSGRDPGLGAPGGPSLAPATAQQVLAAVRRPGARGVLVNVWATWCLPCRKEMPELEALRPRLAERGIDLVGVSVDTEKDAPVAEYAAARVTYPIYRLDPAEMGRLYRTDEVTVPLSFLLEPDGRVAELIPGWSDASRRRFEAMLGGAAGGR